MELSDDNRILKLEKKLEKADCYKKVFGSEDGQAVLLDLARKLYFDSPTIKPGDTVIEIARKEGMREAYCLILRETMVDMIGVSNIIAKLSKTEKPRQEEFFNNIDDIGVL